MSPHALIAIVDAPLEESEIAIIAVLVASAAASALYIRRLRSELRHQQSKLADQTRFIEKLNRTVDRMLVIDREGEIDGKRRGRIKKG